ncbi:hypothetical protein XENTR_v10006226 [Xenopus tropicalis]|nr:hypothetical protein XENTR_v10006226 [Xenopus tropicalis]
MQHSITRGQRNLFIKDYNLKIKLTFTSSKTFTLSCILPLSLESFFGSLKCFSMSNGFHFKGTVCFFMQRDYLYMEEEEADDTQLG